MPGLKKVVAFLAGKRLSRVRGDSIKTVRLPNNILAAPICLRHKDQCRIDLALGYALLDTLVSRMTFPLHWLSIDNLGPIMQSFCFCQLPDVRTVCMDAEMNVTSSNVESKPVFWHVTCIDIADQKCLRGKILFDDSVSGTGWLRTVISDCPLLCAILWWS